MAFFGLSDIKFNKGPINTTKGPLASLVGSPFQSNSLKYPLDVGSADKGHYMVIYIRKQENSSATDMSQGNSVTNAVGGLINNKTLNGTFGNELKNKISNGVGEIGKAVGGVVKDVSSSINQLTGGVKSSISGLNDVFGQTKSLLSGNSAATQNIINRNIKDLQSSGNLIGSIRKTQLTKDFISLYMPDTLHFTYNQEYDSLSLGDSILGQLGAAGASVADGTAKATDAGISALKAIISEKVGKGAGSAVALAAYAATGAVVNPLLEVLYRSPQFRTFQYDFRFYPRSEREAVEVQKIINLLKYHSAPEFEEGKGIGLLIPPSQFDIKFFYSGSENKNIPQIGTCVLKTIDVNYAPNGWASYEVPGQNSATLGGTGMPVAIQLSLQFQEITYLTKNNPGSVNQSNPMSNEYMTSPKYFGGTSEGE